jgi:hypothetical protein
MVQLDEFQGVETIDGSQVLLLCHHGPPGLSIHPSFDWEFDFLPDKVLMANGEWDPLLLESFAEDEEEWFDALQDHGECYFFDCLSEEMVPDVPNASPITITPKDEDSLIFVDSLEDSNRSRGAFYEQVHGRTVFSAACHVLGFPSSPEIPKPKFPWQLYSHWYHDQQIVLISPMLRMPTTSDPLNPWLRWLKFISSIFKWNKYANLFLKPLF